MFGKGVLKGLRVTLKEFVNTYVDDVKKIPSRYAGGREVIDQTQNLDQMDGLFTIQYPEERRKLPERFRYIPMLLRDAETGEDRCTACGICAKVCPPQCIWIVRDRDANGKPLTKPSEFYIDASICMNCGLCAEFCPFDAIKMNHDFEITAYERMPSLVFDLEELTVPTTYYAAIQPTQWAQEEADRAAKAAGGSKAAGAAHAAPAAPAAPGAVGGPTIPVAAPAAPGGRPSPEEMERRRAEARARKAAQEGGEGGAPAAPSAAAPAAPAPVPAKSGGLSPEELERRRAEARARKAAQAAGGETAAPEAAAPAPTPPMAPATPPGVKTGGLSQEELDRRRAEARARKAAQAAAAGEAPADAAAAQPAVEPGPAPAAEPAPPAPPVTPPAATQPPGVRTGGLSQEELDRRRAEARARKAARDAAGGQPPEGGDKSE